MNCTTVLFFAQRPDTITRYRVIAVLPNVRIAKNSNAGGRGAGVAGRDCGQRQHAASQRGERVRLRAVDRSDLPAGATGGGRAGGGGNTARLLADEGARQVDCREYEANVAGLLEDLDLRATREGREAEGREDGADELL